MEFLQLASVACCNGPVPTTTPCRAYATLYAVFCCFDNDLLVLIWRPEESFLKAQGACTGPWNKALNSLYSCAISTRLVLIPCAGERQFFTMFKSAYTAAMRHYRTSGGWYPMADIWLGMPTHRQFTSLQAYWPGSSGPACFGMLLVHALYLRLKAPALKLEQW